MNLIARTRDGLTALPVRVNRLFEGFFDDGVEFTGPAVPTWTPAMDVVETAEAILVLVDLPGVDPTEVEVSYHQDRLEIDGRRPAPTPHDARWYRFERPTGSFHRTILLPVAIDVEKAAAKNENGQLRILLPKVAEAQPKRITVQGS
jgi:HSP20 family protein